MNKQTKRCRTCGEWLPLEEFSRHSGMAEGLRHDCKPCYNEYVRTWRLKKAMDEGKLLDINALLKGWDVVRD